MGIIVHNLVLIIKICYPVHKICIILQILAMENLTPKWN